MAEAFQRWQYVCWTLFDVTDEQYVILRGLVPDKAKYVVFGRETCPDTGKKHLQGYFELSCRLRVTQLRKLLTVKKGDQSFHCEKRLGSPQQAADYCKKDGDFEEFGVITPPGQGQGKRSDLDSVKADLDAGDDMSTIADKHFACYLRYGKSLAAYRQLKTPERTWQTLCIVVYGCSNAGKSVWAANAFDEKPYFLKKGNNGCWWDKYEQQRVVVVDEFTGWLQFNMFKTLIDNTPHTVDAKGGYRIFNSQIVIFLSNDAPDSWWSSGVINTDNDKRAFNRRLHIVVEAKERKDIHGNHLNYYAVLRKCFLPRGVVLPSNWALIGENHEDSLAILNHDGEMPTLTRLREGSALEKNGQWTMDKSGGVILHPPLPPSDVSFGTGIRSLMDYTIFYTEEKWNPDIVPGVTESPEPDVSAPRNSLEYYDNDMPTGPSVNVFQPPPKPSKDKKKTKKAKAVREDQVYRKPTFKSNYPELTWKDVDKQRKRRKKNPYIDDEAEEAGASSSDSD